MFFKVAVFCMLGCCLFPFILAREPQKNSCHQLQIVSEVYKKQPYIIIPTAYLDYSLLNKILTSLQRYAQPDWQVQFVPLQGEWTQHLKCWPAANIEFYRNDSQGVRSGGLLLIYPKSYRGIIEDPLAQTEPPIVHIGSTRRLSFYYYPNIPKANIPYKIIQCAQHLNNSDLD